tara:strand:+ start:4489 stop:5895 length:1407 start_codon:yes stop_codon:yes gene_type:complete
MNIRKIIIIFICTTLSLYSEVQSNKDEKSFISKENKSFIEDSLNIHYFMWGGRILYVRNKDSKIFDTSAKKWKKNIMNPEWNDGDGFATNYIYHPYFGALYYQIYKDLGYNDNQAYLGTVLQSSLWEFAIEGTVEKPSIIDLLVTPGLGIPLGIYFEKTNKKLEQSSSRLARTLSYIINPAKIFLNEGDAGFFNPITGTFMIYKPFKYSEEDDLDYDYNFLNNNGSYRNLFRLRTYFFDVKQYRGGGSDIFYFVDMEFANNSKDFSLFLSFPWAGAYDGNDKSYEVVDNGFEIGNMKSGFKKLIYASSKLKFSGILSLNFPTSTIWDDSKNRLEKLYSNSLFLKDTLHDVTVLTSGVEINTKYFSFGTSIESFFNSDDYSGEREENFLVYDGKVSLFRSNNSTYLISYDFKIINQITEDNKPLDALSSLNLRIQKNFNVGFGIIIPNSGNIKKYVHNGITADLVFPFN